LPDPGPALLGAALGAVRAAVDDVVAANAGTLAAKLGVTPVAAALQAAEHDLADARTHAQAFADALQPPPIDPARVRAATAELGKTVAALDKACTDLGAPAGSLARAVSAVHGALTPTRFTGDLGVAAGTNPWSVQGTTLSYRLAGANSAPHAGFRLLHPALQASLEWTTGRVALALDAEVDLELDPGFLAKLLAVTGAGPTRAALAVGVDSEHGLTVGAGRRRTGLAAGSGSGPIRVRDVTLGLDDAGGGASLELTSVLSGSLGSALQVRLDGAGLLVTVAQSGVTTTVRPPEGGRIAVDAAGLVHGGGAFTHKGADYAGGFGVTVGPVSATANLIVADQPFSLTLLIFTRFPAPVQLGLGFTLNGVGGLLAVNRSLSTDAFIAHLHDGTVGALLFPPDSSRMPALETLEQVFPKRPGAFAVGPAFDVGWGARTLVSARVGVFVVVPDPRIVVLGTVRAAIPAPALPLVDLRATIVGELREQRLLMRVGLDPGSRVAGYPLSGDVGLLLRTGDTAEFAFSAGGFHPGYRGPAELSGMRRLALDLSPPTLVTLRAEAYLAVTSNALMVGARVDLGIDLDVADARGYLSFDALVVVDPLHFAVDVRAGISVSVLGETVAGVALALHLEGPHPWVASGTATLELLFLPDIDLSFGPLRWPSDAQLPPAPTSVSALDLVIAAFREPGAARTFLPVGVVDPVVLREDRPAAALHPLGGVELRQRAVPLHTPIETVGPAPSREGTIEIASTSIGVPGVGVVPTTDLFAPGQFLKLRDDQRLSRAAFEPHVSGRRVDARAAHTPGPSRPVAVAWKTIVPGQVLPADGVGTVPHGGAGGVLAVGAVARARSGSYAVAGERLEAIA
jgi:hypothetical protein